MLSIWWDWKGILYFELLRAGKTINSDVYCQQLDKLKTEIEKKTPRIDQQEGRRLPPRQRTTSHIFEDLEKLRELDWEILSHPPYFPDLAPSDYHLLRSI